MTTNLTIHLTQTTTQKVGTLAIKNRKIYFEYDKDFLKTGIEVSPYKLKTKQTKHFQLNQFRVVGKKPTTPKSYK